MNSLKTRQSTDGQKGMIASSSGDRSLVISLRRNRTALVVLRSQLSVGVGCRTRTRARPGAINRPFFKLQPFNDNSHRTAILRGFAQTPPVGSWMISLMTITIQETAEMPGSAEARAAGPPRVQMLFMGARLNAKRERRAGLLEDFAQPV